MFDGGHVAALRTALLSIAVLSMVRLAIVHVHTAKD